MCNRASHPMFHVITAIGFCMFACFCASAAPCQLRVGTFNIRCISKDDKGARSWGARRGELVDFANKLKCDVIGFQEVTPKQLDFLKSRMSDYTFVATFREKNRKSGEACPVAYRRSRFDLEDSGTFWLSATPDKPGSRSWKTSLPRICTYAILKDKRSGQRICFANTHPDHKSAEARVKGMEVIAARLEKVRKGASVVLVGDHNCTDNDGPAAFLRKHYDDAILVSKAKPKGPWRSFTGWGKRDKEPSAVDALKMPPGERDKTCGKRIDYIYVSRGVTVSSYETFAQKRKDADEYFSDHQPVVADIVGL